METTTLTRLATFLFVLSACVLYAKSDGTEKLDQVYGVSDSQDVIIASPKCAGLEGSVKHCSECYTCDHEIVTKHRNNGEHITELKLNDANCASSERICCFSQKNLVFRDKNSEGRTLCGNSNPEGYPRTARASSRDVLQGEYPWRAWIYHTSLPAVPMCAATYVNKDVHALLTAASCVEGRSADTLRVRFSRDPSSEAFAVNRIEVHEKYDQATHENNIAVLSVKGVPQWTRRACLPIEPVLIGTACVAVSANDYYLNQAIPRQSMCLEKGTLHESLMCTATHKDDLKPEFGGGVYCVDEQSNEHTYSLVGVHLASAENGLAALNTNVTHFVKWLSAKFEILGRKPKNYFYNK